MGIKICTNVSCENTTTHEWKRGWPLRSGGYAQLCYTCGSAYEKGVYCDTFHLEESGWRDCYICIKRLHCGCIASKSLLELLDHGGVSCTSCTKSVQFQSIREEIPNDFGLLIKNAGDLESTPQENREAGNTFDEGKIAQLCRLMEANAPNILCQSEGADKNASAKKFRKEDIMHQIGEASSGFSTATKSSPGQSKFTQLDSARSIVDMRDIHGPLAQPSLSMSLGAPSGAASFLPYPSGVVEGIEQGKTSHFQGQRSRPILPKPSKPGLAGNSDTNKAVSPELRIARPPGEGRGKNQLLPRYWPRITDQELQKMSGEYPLLFKFNLLGPTAFMKCMLLLFLVQQLWTLSMLSTSLNSNIVPLFEKVLSASDAGRIGRLVLPKACAEAYFPPISQSEGLPLRIQDVKGREWTFQFRFWPNNNSRMYVLEGVTPCIQSMQLQAGDTITFSRIDPGGKLVIGYRKATNNTLDAQDIQTSSLPNGAALAEASFSADGDTGWNKSDSNEGRINGDPVQQPTTEKKRTRNIGPKSKRLLMNSEDALELRLTWEEAQDLLRPPPSVNPSIVTIEDHEFEEYDEPPVFGKRTIFADRPSGGQEQWAQCDDCSKWRKLPQDALLPPKWTCVDNVWDPSRCSCSEPEEMSLKDLDNLLRVSKDFKKRRVVERRKPSPECEPTGLDALASAAVLGDNIGDSGEPSVGATTRHPRHRPGCTCIVCIQPPSGKGKHKPNCTCMACMTVKRRFKTLMLRKKKRQAEISQKADNHKDECEIVGSINDESSYSPIDKSSENEGNQNQKQHEAGETSAGQIDLNCHPSREDVQLDMQGLTTFENYVQENGLSSLIYERQASLGNCSQSQSNGENMRRLSDEAFLASIGWNRESRGGD